MSQIQIGCQFYTWQMSGQKYVGQLPHILQVVERAGYRGIEPETCMLGAYLADPRALKDVLDAHGLQLGSVAFVEDWIGPTETEKERGEAAQIFDYLKLFPGAQLVLCQMAGINRSNLHQRQVNAIACVNAVAARALDRGIACSFHPNSPPGSLFRILEDYRFLLDRLDTRVVGFAPDTGHIAKGGMAVVELFTTYLPLIKHVHFKDMDASGGWTAMGAGMIDFRRIVTMLKDSGYAGWIMVEEESPAAEVNPDTAAAKNGEYIHRSLLPLL